MPKAALEWHGSTLLRRTVGLVARATGGPVVVVRATGQDLPDLPETVIVVDDPREGKGPVQGIAAGLTALAGQADTAFVTSTDLPFLHPAFIRRVLRGLDAPDGPDIALPVARGYQQPLAAAYRTSLAELAERLVAEDRLRPAFLFAECDVVRLDAAALLADPVLAALDPNLDSVLNVNTPDDYEAARRRPAPGVTVQLSGALTQAGRPGGLRGVRAATVQAAAAAVDLPLDGHVAAAINDERVTRDPETPLVTGDAVFFAPADSRLCRELGPSTEPNSRRKARIPALVRLPAGRLSRALQETAAPVRTTGRFFGSGDEAGPACAGAVSAPRAVAGDSARDGRPGHPQRCARPAARLWTSQPAGYKLIVYSPQLHTVDNPSLERRCARWASRRPGILASKCGSPSRWSGRTGSCAPRPGRRRSTAPPLASPRPGSTTRCARSVCSAVPRRRTR